MVSVRGFQSSTARKIFDNLNQALEAKFDNPYPIVGESHVLFLDAVNAFDAKVYGGTALLCGATLETAFFVFLTRKWDSAGLMSIEHPLGLDGKPRRVEFDELVSAVKSKVKFSQTQLDAINRIHDDGNLIAHFVSRRDKELLRVSKEIGARSKQFSEKDASLQDS